MVIQLSKLINRRKNMFYIYQMKEVYNQNKQNRKNTRMKGSLQYRKCRKIRFRKKLTTSNTLKVQGYNISHLSTPSSNENTKRNDYRLNSSNIQLFRQNTFHKAESYPSCFKLMKPLPHKSANLVTLSTLLEPSFPVLMYKLRDLISFGVLLLQSVNLTPAISRKTLNQLVQSIALSYNIVSYHNFSHAFSLALLNYECIMKQPNFRSMFSDEELFYTLIAGLSHDLNHKGTNNNFEVKRQSALAKQYKYTSVLQNMHIATLWKILQQNPHFNFLRHSPDPKSVKKIITGLILSTDMAFHNNKLQLSKTKRQNGENNLSQKWFMMEQLFHASDIGNPTYDFDNYITWASLLTYQFNEQAQLEQKMNLEVTSCFLYRDLSTLYKDQIWFLGSIVQPLWKQLSLSWQSMNSQVERIQKNLKKIETLKQLLNQ